MVSAESGKPVELASIPVDQNVFFLKVQGDFADRADLATFYYSLDNREWKPIGSPLKMRYTLPHFMGYRFGLFSFATKSAGGFVDFDYFHVAADSTQ